MFCPKCGIGNLVDQKYCRGCGHGLTRHKAALENNFEVAVERIKSGSTILGVCAVGLMAISLMSLGVWLTQNDAGVFFTLVPVLAFVIPATIVGLVRLNRAYCVLSAPGSGKKTLQQSNKNAVQLSAASATDPLDRTTRVPASVTEHTTLNLESPGTASEETRTNRDVDSPSPAS